MDILQDIQIMKASLEQLKKQIKQSFEINKLKNRSEDLRPYVKHNERLSHCESASFNLRTFIESDMDDFIHRLEEVLDETDYLEDEIKNFLGDG